MTAPIAKHLALLGKRVADKVTGYTGVIESVSFDLYGCVKVVINPGLDKDHKLGESRWFDVSRVDVLPDPAVMDPPDWLGDTAQARGEQGAAEKPLPHG